ncbi:hypothetical protein [Kineosporia succinea]|uniref:Secreted protein n=1 Tax=Kineosporia succinea TaxID=84632 RepID=A0ABT9P9K5_9ACTN|nr:hypothetical protein [Kineosporia succinea]MDP9829376.1 hypothetical protein [Kineosporia succinea]
MAAVIGIIVVAAVVCVLTVRYLCRRYRPALKDGEVDYHGVAVKMQPHPRRPDALHVFTRTASDARRVHARLTRDPGIASAQIIGPDQRTIFITH